MRDSASLQELSVGKLSYLNRTDHNPINASTVIRKFPTLVSLEIININYLISKGNS